MEEWWRNLVLWLLFMWRLTAGQMSLPEAELKKKNCFPTNPVRLIRNISPFCASTTRIAVESLKYACQGQGSPDCSAPLSPVPGSTLEGAVHGLSGVQGATYPVTTSLCNKKDIIMEMSYYCIPDSRILEMCTKKTISSKGFVYIMSSKYPNTVYVTEEPNCKCSVAVIKNSHSSKNTKPNSINITMVTVHTELEPGQQLILMSPGSVLLRNITKDTTQHEMSFDQVPYPELDLLWQSKANRSNGLFWVGFQSSDPASTIKVSCNKPMATLINPITSPPTLFHYSFKTSSKGASGSSGQTPTIRTELFDTPSDDRIWIPIIAGVVGGILLLLLIIIVIICLIKKNQSPKEKIAPKFDEQHTYKSKPAAITYESNNTYRSPTLPPIFGSLVSGGQRRDITGRNVSRKDKHTQAMFDDVDTQEETRKKKRRRKKPKRWTDMVTDHSVDFMENSDSPNRKLNTTEFHVDIK